MNTLDELRKGSFNMLQKYFYDFSNWKPILMKEHPVEIYTNGDSTFNGFVNEVCVNHGALSLHSVRMLLPEVKSAITFSDGSRITDERLKSIGSGYSVHTNAIQVPLTPGIWKKQERYCFIYVPMQMNYSTTKVSKDLEVPSRDLVYFCPLSSTGLPQIDRIKSCEPGFFVLMFDTTGLTEFEGVRPNDFWRVSPRFAHASRNIASAPSTVASLDRKQLPVFVKNNLEAGTLKIQDYRNIVQQLLTALGTKEIYRNPSNNKIIVLLSGIPIEVSCYIREGEPYLKFITLNATVTLSGAKDVLRFLKYASTIERGSITSKAFQTMPKFKDFAKSLALLDDSYNSPHKVNRDFVVDYMPSQAAISILNGSMRDFERQLTFLLSAYLPCMYKPTGVKIPKGSNYELISMTSLNLAVDNSLSAYPSLTVDFSFTDKIRGLTFAVRIRDALTSLAWLETVTQNGRSLYTETRPSRAPDYFVLTSLALLNRQAILAHSGTFRAIASAFDLIQNRKEL